jgi:hypothetical protein
MASITPRASRFWTDSNMTYFPDDEGDVEEQQNLIPGDDPNDGRTPLDKTIDQIGMGTCAVCATFFTLWTVMLGSYQWTLLLLCGFGRCYVSSIRGGVIESRSRKVGWQTTLVCRS